MGTLFRKQTTRPLPHGAEIIVKAGKRIARWQSRGKTFTAPLTGTEDRPRIITTAKAFSARYRDHTGRIVERCTNCRDKQTAEQMLSKWEREQEQIHAGVLDAGQLETARAAGGAIEPHLLAYEQSLIARDVSKVYRENAMRGIRRLVNDLGLAKLKDLRREKIEPWFAKAIGDGMTARTRNYYRESIVLFEKWLHEGNLISDLSLNKLPIADRRLNPVRQRRALTEDELNRLLTVARTRPLDDARTIRTGKRKGELGAEVRPEVIQHLEALGHERVLIYRTLVLTGLRLNELATLTVSQVDLTPGAELVRLEAKNEKNRAGSSIPLRSDLAEELRQWIGEREMKPAAKLFTVPAGLRRILDRDLEAAGIPKRDERGRTIDVHAFRTTFGTMLSMTGTAPRTAQAAMRHSDIKLTMGTYTDPKLLDVREAMERLPALTTSNETRPELPAREVALHVALPTGKIGHFEAITGNIERELNSENVTDETDVNPYAVNENAPQSSSDNSGALIGLTGFEPATSWSRTFGHPIQTPEKQGDLSTSPFALHSTLHHSPETPASTLARLLAELAALPLEQRAALAALLTPPVPPIASAPSKPAPLSPKLDDDCPLDAKQ